MKTPLKIALTVLALTSAFIFPWPVTALLALFSALWLPLLPVTVGILVDALYYAPHASLLPWGTVAGAFVTAASFFVRRRLAARIIDA